MGVKHRHREWLLDQLGRECVECSSMEHLELDHIDPKSRKEPGAHPYSTRERAAAELPLLQVLCRDCHWAKTAVELGKRIRWEHGTRAGYFSNHCRCNPCKEAGREYNARRHA